MAISNETISGLLLPFLGEERLSQSQLAMVSTYLELLQSWNAKFNLTAVRDPEEIITRHFGESFFAAQRLSPITADPRNAIGSSAAPNFTPVSEEIGSSVEAGTAHGTTIDIGSGAGFPGLPIKIFSPGIELTLIESNQKKVAFLREVVRLLKLDGVTVWPKRAEQLSRSAELVTLRAVEHFESILLTASNLVRPGGRLALLIGVSQFETAESLLERSRSQSGTANSQIGKIDWAEPIPIPLSRNRILAVANFS